MNKEAERFNGWAAMLGIVAAVGAYATGADFKGLKNGKKKGRKPVSRKRGKIA